VSQKQNGIMGLTFLYLDSLKIIWNLLLNSLRY